MRGDIARTSKNWHSSRRHVIYPFPSRYPEQTFLTIDSKAEYRWRLEIILLLAGCVVPYLCVFFLLRFMNHDKLSHYIHYIWTFTTLWATGASVGK